MPSWLDTEEQMSSSSCQLRPLLFIFWCQIKKDPWQYLWSSDFLSHISTDSFLIIFGFWAGAVHGTSLIWFVFCFGFEAVTGSSVILGNRQLGDLSPMRSILLQGCSGMSDCRVPLSFLSLFMIQLDCESPYRLGD